MKTFIKIFLENSYLEIEQSVNAWLTAGDFKLLSLQFLEWSGRLIAVACFQELKKNPPKPAPTPKKS